MTSSIMSFDDIDFYNNWAAKMLQLIYDDEVQITPNYIFF